MEAMGAAASPLRRSASLTCRERSWKTRPSPSRLFCKSRFADRRTFSEVRPLFSLVDVVKFLANEFPGLRGRGFSITGVMVRPIDGCSSGHETIRCENDASFFHQIGERSIADCNPKNRPAKHFASSPTDVGRDASGTGTVDSLSNGELRAFFRPRTES